MKEITRGKLESLLNENVPKLTEKTIVVWGTGNTAQLYYEALTRLKEEGFEVSAYCDSNHQAWGQKFNGKTIIKPETLKDMSNVCVLICTPHMEAIREISEQLEQMKIEYYIIGSAILKNHAKEVMECYDMFEDEKSKYTYANIVIQHIKGGYIIDFEKEDNAYFAIKSFDISTENEVFVDCGAYVGDTIERYIWNRGGGVFKKIIAFEPDRMNYQAMISRVERLRREWNLSEEKIELYPYGVASKNGDGFFGTYENNNSLGSKIIEATTEDENCKLVALDKYIKEPYSFLKADIESYEYQMLLGAQKSIKEYKPNIAVCIYHNAVDLYSIPILIKSMVREYKMAVRHHSNTLAETVLYCWI